MVEWKNNNLWNSNTFNNNQLNHEFNNDLNDDLNNISLEIYQENPEISPMLCHSFPPGFEENNFTPINKSNTTNNNFIEYNSKI